MYAPDYHCVNYVFRSIIQSFIFYHRPVRHFNICRIKVSGETEKMKNFIRASLCFFSLLFIIMVFSAAFFTFHTAKSYTVSENRNPEPYLPLIGAENAVININTSDVYQLQSIPYIGGKASEIVNLRSELRGFNSIEQIALVSGIGLKSYLKACQYIRAD